MQDITHKQVSLRTATAIGIIFCDANTISMIREEQLPKGNLFDVARAAAFLGAKHTPQILPHCHPVTIDGMDVAFEFLDREKHKELFPETVLDLTGIVITGTARSIGKTGIEMEILTGVSVAALEIYDMLKPVDKHLEIGNIRLLNKSGGKSDRVKFSSHPNKCAVLVCSDSTFNHSREDTSGKAIMAILELHNAVTVHYSVVADDKDQIRKTLLGWVDEGIRFIFTTGGTGLGPRDNTTEAVKDIITKEAPGVAEAMRAYGQSRTPLAMMSRSIAGTINNSMLVALPGSMRGATESLEAILPALFHAGKMIDGQGH